MKYFGFVQTLLVLVDVGQGGLQGAMILIHTKSQYHQIVYRYSRVTSLFTCKTLPKTCQNTNKYVQAMGYNVLSETLHPARRLEKQHAWSTLWCGGTSSQGKHTEWALTYI